MINLYLSFMFARQKWSMIGKRIRIRGSGNYLWTVCQRNQLNVLIRHLSNKGTLMSKTIFCSIQSTL